MDFWPEGGEGVAQVLIGGVIDVLGRLGAFVGRGGGPGSSIADSVQMSIY